MEAIKALSQNVLADRRYDGGGRYSKWWCRRVANTMLATNTVAAIAFSQKYQHAANVVGRL